MGDMSPFVGCGLGCKMLIINELTVFNRGYHSLFSVVGNAAKR